MPSDYPGKIIILGYFIDKQDAGDPDERAEWSEDLFTRFDAHIVAACKAGGLNDPSDEARAIMAVMAENAPGGSPKTKAGHAVAAYLAYRGF
jgi:hypothetical protein